MAHSPLVFAVALLLSSCALTAGPGAVEVRVANRSARDFDRVVVAFTSDRAEYGAIPAGGASPYRSVHQAYRYGYVEVWVDTARAVIQPIDFVGEEPLGGGRYTYALYLASDLELTLRLERD